MHLTQRIKPVVKTNLSQTKPKNLQKLIRKPILCQKMKLNNKGKRTILWTSQQNKLLNYFWTLIHQFKKKLCWLAML